ncbi:MAG TPA: HAMP domain-containing sensor histidine kinase [Planctomycetota bacterium]|nr:HAMP domain-containing sensor histidine kinase [Planctomycetota bacterium]
MSSGLDRRAGLSFSLRLVVRNAALFLVMAVAFYVLTRHVLYEALSGEWEAEAAIAETSWFTRHADEPEDVRAEIRAAQIELSAALRTQAERRFNRVYAFVAFGLLIAGAAGGLVLTYTATGPMRRIVRTVDEILSTGNLDRRVDVQGVRGTRAEVAMLMNRLLDRNASLIRAIRDTLDNVGHDLRTPMTRLRATAEEALQRPDDADAAREAIADCLEESERVLAMLNTLMDVAEAETGTMRLDRRRVELDEVVRDVVELYALVAEERGASVATEIRERVAASADPARVRQALANLLDNALKYGGKAVTVSLSREGGDAAVLTVADRGQGIAAEDLPRIWDRLYRGDKSRSERGLGLGLSFVRAIAVAHGGSASVESAPGKGATFRIRLPATA